MQQVRSVLAVAGLLSLSACANLQTPVAPDPGRPVTTPASAPSTVPPSGAASELARLSTVDRHPATPAYDRKAFGTAWADTDHNGCNQRDDVLLRDATPGTVRTQQQGRCDHDVLAGTWHDAYTGRTLTFTDLKDPRQAQAIQIDHVVPLAEAWVSGAAAWLPERRRAFATDLDELLAVDGPTNMGKGDGDPAAWRPRKAFQCQYAVRWIDTKSRWQLAVDASERRALQEMLGSC
ncbi:HNH endonuclease family protein [Nocardioides sp. CER19]|uniref:HNH endonuclease family protein n=1 Tax=Nocardioides sp. CER19 TaxID=3038538 RepID=UPI0024471C45|nr:HNH endonuclease family protein [Nocardioides sp. CER19]MDH2414741.1 HNH endonuclease family protein [Nocardioides sp. CER19]